MDSSCKAGLDALCPEAGARAKPALGSTVPEPVDTVPAHQADGAALRRRVLARRKRLRTKVRHLEALLEERSQIFRTLRRAREELEVLEKALASPPDAQRLAITPHLRQTDAAELALRRSGKPLAIAELVHLVREQGARVGGVRPRATLASALSQDPRFVAGPMDGGYRWWLAQGDGPDPTLDTAAGGSDQD